MKFEPILKDLPLSFAIANRKYFINEARSKAWGGDVFFFPSTNKLDVSGCSIYGYFYGKPFVDDKNPLWNKTDIYGNTPHYSNCTGVQGAFYHLRSGIVLTALLGSAVGTYARYSGRKDGGNFNGQYLGDVVQEGDMLIFADIDKNGNPTLNSDGHIVSVETTDNNMTIMEGAYSRKDCYRDKACITYTIKKSDLITGKKIALRTNTKYPYSEILYGVIHTGDVFDKTTNKKEDVSKLSKINKLAKEIVDLSK